MKSNTSQKWLLHWKLNYEDSESWSAEIISRVTIELPCWFSLLTYRILIRKKKFHLNKAQATCWWRIYTPSSGLICHNDYELHMMPYIRCIWCTLGGVQNVTYWNNRWNIKNETNKKGHTGPWHNCWLLPQLLLFLLYNHWAKAMLIKVIHTHTHTRFEPAVVIYKSLVNDSGNKFYN